MPNKTTITIGVCGSLRRGADQNRYLLDETFIGTFYVPGILMYTKDDEEPVLSKGPGLVVMDFFEVKKNKLDLLSRMNLLGENSKMTDITYKGMKVKVPIVRILPGGYVRNFIGDYLKWRQSPKRE